jgi:predicted esterase
VRGKWSAVLFVAACRGPSSDRAVPPPPDASSAAEAGPPKELPNVTTDWCTAGLLGLDAETCYLPPARGRTRPPPRLLVYLHGIIPPQVGNSPQKENVMTAVKSAAQRAGIAVIVPRGIQGVGPSGSKDWWAWPTSPDKHAELALGLAKRIEGAKKKLEDALGVTFERTYLAGSSNGAYFAVNLALRGELEVDGLGAMSGGAPTTILRKKPLPVYVGYGKYDEPSKTGGLALARAAEAAGWKTKVAEHPFPHGAREVYIDEAFAFWDSVP